jgi:hypothetical protein
MAGAGVPLRTIQEWLGHRSSQTTEIYADYAPHPHERQWVEQAFAGNEAGNDMSESETNSNAVKPNEYKGSGEGRPG